MTVLTKEIIEKLNIDGPRYTSYPTAPIWSESPSNEEYIKVLRKFSSTKRPVSIYTHIPFCEKRCYFCACNVMIRKKKDQVGDEYLDFLEKEIVLITSHLGKMFPVKQLHLGGGTPTYLTDSQLRRLDSLYSDNFDVSQIIEKSIEIDPRTITYERLKVLKSLGFNRLSFGAQDFEPSVQKAINRVQPYELVAQLMEDARGLKFESVNLDFIYGLPNQTPESFRHTIEKISSLKPDRIALYSFAYVPWLHSHQKLLDKWQYPTPEEKIALYLQAQKYLLEQGYKAIAMDHFALETDDLYDAFSKGTLYRSFMGYTTQATDDYIGLGSSAIGDVDNHFFQNVKEVKTYYSFLEKGQLPVSREYSLNNEDVLRKWVIKSLMCQFKVVKKDFRDLFKKDFNLHFKDQEIHLKKCQEQGLLTETKDEVTVSELGRLFVRNIAMGFDQYLPTKTNPNQFSKVV